MKLLRGSVTLQAMITLVFALLILPALAIVIGFSFYENSSRSDGTVEPVHRGRQPGCPRNVRTSSSAGRRGLAINGRSGGDHAGVLPGRPKFKLSL